MAEFLQQAHTLNLDRVGIAGYYVSEKLDGTRCLWDGGLSRALPTQQVPWANLDKDFRPIATGLWSRYGNVIAAPDWFLNQLPPFPLDGELWCGRKQFQKLRSIIGKHKPNSDEWEAVEYAVFDSPSIESLFGTRKIKNTHFMKGIDFDEVNRWIKSLDESRLAEYVSTPKNARFEEVLVWLSENLESEGRIYLHRQTKLSQDEKVAREQLASMIEKICDGGGEGVVVRKPGALWEPKRSRFVLKHKPSQDDEGMIIGFTSGRKTAKGSKLLGKIGALILDYRGQRLELAGLTNDEREFSTAEMTKYAGEHPGCEMPPGFAGKFFRHGQVVTFTYRELSDDKLPKEARYLRHRGVE